MKKRKTYEVSIINKTHSKTYSDETKFYTSDTALELNFQLKEVEYDFDSAEIILLNVDDRSLVTRPVSKSAEGFTYEIEDDIVEHYGEWKGQLKFNEGGEIYVSSPVSFRIENDLNNDRPPQLTEVTSWKELRKFVDKLIVDLQIEQDETLGFLENRQDTVESKFDLLQQEMTDKDPISAPEIIAARGGEETLSHRLDKDHQEVTEQLAQITNEVEEIQTNKTDKLYTDEKLKLKRDKTIKITGADLDTANDVTKIKLINLSEEVQQAMAGTAPVISSVADGSLTSSKYADGSITLEKTDFLSNNINRFDKEKAIQGYAVNTSTGNISANPTYFTSDFCIVSPSTEYTISRLRLYAFYTETGDFISGNDLVSNTQATITAPATAKYLRFSTYVNSSIDTVMLVEGATLPLTYVPFKIQMKKLLVGNNNIEDEAITNNKMADGSISARNFDSDVPYYFTSKLNPLMYGVDKLMLAEWEMGNIYASTGHNENTTKVIRTNNYIHPTEDLQILLLDNKYKIGYREYDSNNVYIGPGGWYTADALVPFVSGNKYRIVVSKVDSSAMTNNDILNINNILVVGQGTSNLFNPNAMSDKIKNDLSLVKMDTILGTGKKYVAVYGRMGYAPYNTLEAIKMAKHAGAWGIEIDLRLTADGDIVLFHEEKIHETTNETDQKYIYEYTTSELKEFNITGGATIYYTHDIKIPTLDETLMLCKELNLVPMLDMKNDGGSYEKDNQNLYIDTVIGKLKNHGMLGQCVLISSYQTSLTYMRSKAPYTWLAVKSLLKYGATAESGIAIAKAVGGNIIMQPEDGGMPELITDELLTKYHDAGYLSKYSDFIHTITPDNQYKNSIRYFAHISSADGGNTWSVGDKSANQQVTVQKIKVGTYDALSITFDNLEYWDVSHLRASIYADGNTDPLLIIKSGTDAVSKSIVVLFNYNNSAGVFGQLPTNTEFRLNIVF